MSPIRQLATVDIPATGKWVIDPGHAEIAFIGRHFGITKIRGRFTGVEGTVQIAEDPNNSTVAVELAMDSVSSGDKTRDEHLRSPDFFDVSQFPTATFRSTLVAIKGASGTMTGDLTMKSTTRPVTLDVSFEGAATDPWGGQRAVFHATGSLNREDWGLTWNMVLEAGGLLVSKEIRLEIDVELILQT
jgi:polyisoprenoid-binding protein YceI